MVPSGCVTSFSELHDPSPSVAIRMLSWFLGHGAIGRRRLTVKVSPGTRRRLGRSSLPSLEHTRGKVLDFLQFHWRVAQPWQSFSCLSTALAVEGAHPCAFCKGGVLDSCRLAFAAIGTKAFSRHTRPTRPPL
jgi:hypothetical protein